MKRSHVIAAVALVIASVTAGSLWIALWISGFWFTEVFRTQKGNEPNRAALIRVHNAIDLGDSYSDVLTAFWHQRDKDELGLNVSSPDIWIIDTPLEFGASNWTLQIEFEEASVTAVKVRTMDGPAPLDGPRDRVPAN